MEPMHASRKAIPSPQPTLELSTMRSLLGAQLRGLRQSQGRTLRQVSALAQVSLGYLSEVERGQKEASSELLASICHALDVPLSEVLISIGESLAAQEAELASCEVTPIHAASSSSIRSAA